MQKDTSRDEKTVSILVPSVASATRALIPNRISETLLIFKNVLHGQERPDDERYYIISFHIYELIFVFWPNNLNCVYQFHSSHNFVILFVRSHFVLILPDLLNLQNHIIQKWMISLLSFLITQLAEAGAYPQLPTQPKIL